MATIEARKRKAGTQYTARIRIKRDGEIIHQESETFSKKSLAKAWADRREAELAEPGVLESMRHTGITVGDVLEWYKQDYHDHKAFGRTKLDAINQLIARKSLADLDALSVSSGQLVGHARSRALEGTGPATINNDFVWLRVAFRAVAIGRDVPLELKSIDDAAFLCRKEGLIAKAKRRERRPTIDELKRLAAYFRERDQRSNVQMTDVFIFALFSSRRQDEICRILVDDIDEDRKRVLVREMKHPRVLIDTWVDIPDRAWEVLKRQPLNGGRIFPYNSKTVSSIFTKACKFLGIDDLHFHDLRHECISWLFEMGWDIPRVAMVTGHKSWSSLQRYTHIEQIGDKYEGVNFDETI